MTTSSVMTRMPRWWAARTKARKSAMRAVGRIDAAVVGDVVAVVAQRRGIERQEPQGGDAELVQIVELLTSGPENRRCRRRCVEEGLDVQLIDDRVLVPERIAEVGEAGKRAWCRACVGAVAAGALARDAEDRRRIDGGIEAQALAGAAPAVLRLGQQVKSGEDFSARGCASRRVAARSRTRGRRRDRG